MGALRTACCSAIVVLAVCSMTVPARSQDALGARGIPGVVIVDPGAAAASAPSRALASRLQRAGYATLTVTRDPVAAAAVLERRPSVRGDDIAVVGYGSAASIVLATIVERYDLAVARPPPPNAIRGAG